MSKYVDFCNNFTYDRNIDTQPSFVAISRLFQQEICLVSVFFHQDEAGENDVQNDEPLTSSNCIKITDLPAVISLIEKDSNKGFQEEFQVNNVAHSLY